MLWKGLTLRTLKEEIGTGFDELMDSYDSELRLLVLGGMGRCFTFAQAFRFLRSETATAVEKLLESMSGYNRLLVRYDIGMKQRTDEKSKSFVYTVSESGISKLSRIEPELLGRLHFGKLETFERRRIHHALCVTQVIVNLRDQYRIFDIIPEKVVRAELRRENNQRLLRQQERLSLPGMGDLLVELQRKGETHFFWQEIEVSHKNTAKDLKRKDKNLLFFTSTESQKNKVVHYTGAISQVLGYPFSTDRFQSSFVAPNNFAGIDQETVLREADRKVHEALQQLGEIGTIGAIGALLGKAKSTINESLMKLFKTGNVCQTAASITPGLQSGRPNVLYLMGRQEKIEMEELRRGLSRSLIIQFLVGQYQHKFVKYDQERDIVTTRTRDGSGVTYHLLFDDQRLTVDELLSKIMDREKQLRGKSAISFRFIAHIEKRLSAIEAGLKQSKSQTQVVNLFKVMEHIRSQDRQARAAKMKTTAATATLLNA